MVGDDTHSTVPNAHAAGGLVAHERADAVVLRLEDERHLVLQLRLPAVVFGGDEYHLDLFVLGPETTEMNPQTTQDIVTHAIRVLLVPLIVDAHTFNVIPVRKDVFLPSEQHLHIFVVVFAQNPASVHSR